jgi:CBS domain-containing protein
VLERRELMSKSMFHKRLTPGREPAVEIRETATVKEALALMAAHCLGTAPVVNESGKPVGALRRTKSVRYGSAKAGRAAAAQLIPDELTTRRGGLPAASPGEEDDAAQVWDIMGQLLFAADSGNPPAPSVTPFAGCGLPACM